MLTKTQFLVLFAYRSHITRRLLDCSSALSEEDCKANPGNGQRSIHDLLFHLLNTDHAWRIGLETGQRPPPLRQEDYPDLPHLQAGIELEQAAWQQYLEKLTPEEYEGEFTQARQPGDEASMPRWRALQHVVLHGMQHHTELAQLLTSWDQSPGDIDFIFFNG